MEGYRPLQDAPTTDLVKAHKLLGYLKNVLQLGLDPVVSLWTRGWNGLSEACSLRKPELSQNKESDQKGVKR